MKIAAAPAIVYRIQYAGSGPSKGVKLGTVSAGWVGEGEGISLRFIVEDRVGVREVLGLRDSGICVEAAK